MYDDPIHTLRFRQPHVRPSLAAVARAPDAVPDRDRVARPALAGADPDDLRVRGVERDRANRLDALLVEDGLERGAAVDRLPDAARGGADEQRDLAVRLGLVPDSLRLR